MKFAGQAGSGAVSASGAGQFGTIGTLVASACLLALTGCGTVATVATDEEIVAQRAGEWLAAVRQRDFNGALQYTSPNYRSLTSMTTYSGMYAGAATWTDATVDRVTCEEQTCEVRFMVSYELGRPRIENTRVLPKTWIQLDGQWYIYER